MILNLKLIIFSCFSFTISYLLIKSLIPFFRKQILDTPIDRSSHTLPTPSAGGIGFILPSLIFTLPYIFISAWVSLPLAIVSLIDDIKKIKPITRLIVQLITCITIIYSSPFSVYLNKIDNYILVFFIYFILVFIGLSIINLTNFMDGIDGLVGSCFLIYLMYIVIFINYNMLPLVASLAGFIYWNWSPAKIFMGDTGSTFLGAILFSSFFYSTQISISMGLVTIMFPLYIDAIITLLIRIINKQKISSPHKLHLYQRLHQKGWSHLKITILYASLTLILALTTLIYGSNWIVSQLILIIILGLYINKKYAKKLRF